MQYQPPKARGPRPPNPVEYADLVARVTQIEAVLKDLGITTQSPAPAPPPASAPKKPR